MVCNGNAPIDDGDKFRLTFRERDHTLASVGNYRGIVIEPNEQKGQTFSCCGIDIVSEDDTKIPVT